MDENEQRRECNDSLLEFDQGQGSPDGYFGPDLLSPVSESRVQRLSSTAVYLSCGRAISLEKLTLVGGGTADTLLKVSCKLCNLSRFMPTHYFACKKFPELILR